MKALLIVDVQNDFLPGGSLPIKEGSSILPVINSLLEKKFDLIIASKDWHPPNHGSFAATHRRKVGEEIDLNGLKQDLWPVHCVQGTTGSEFSIEWKSEKVEKVFFKGIDKDIDSYSTFFDNGHRKSTGLYEYLKDKGITEIYIAGLATDFCVKYSVLDALKLNFKVFVVIDACRGVNLHPDDERRALDEMQQAGAHLLTSVDI